MRRGHPNSGGWRGENRRQLRSRGGGPYFGRSRGHFQTLLRFPPSAPHRSHRNYNAHSEIPNEHQRQDHDRNRFRDHHPGQQFHDRNNQSHLLHQMCSKPPPPIDNQQHFYGNQSYGRINHFNVNCHGDIDQRHLPLMPDLTKPPLWDKIPGKSNLNFDNRLIENTYKQQDIDERSFEYTGHRPPASDHYGGSVGATIDNSNAFSRSVDDTVDIVRKRLMNRSESQHSNHTALEKQQYEEEDRLTATDSEIYEESQQSGTTPIRRRIQRQRVNIQKNCDKIKGKIVNQLFKMDKDKIHKLMDNPNSSNKFEYAISSLITESQNSLNRHMRSVAEKSLVTSRDFIQSDNTFYEDTFMRQMQSILDPQDTMLLEDMKPMVLAEIQKVLQLNNLDQNCEAVDDSISQTQEQTDQYPDSSQGYDEDYYQTQLSYDNFHSKNEPVTFVASITSKDDVDYGENKLFVRRPQSSNMAYEKRASMESRRLSAKNSEYDTSGSMESENSQPLFDIGAEQFTEDEDPFAELDKQYHVAVDPNFIENDDDMMELAPDTKFEATTNNLSPNSKTYNQNEDNIHNGSSNKIMGLNENSMDIKKEIDDQLNTLSKSPLKLVSSTNNNLNEKSNEHLNTVKEENKNIEPQISSEKILNIKFNTKICDISPPVNDMERIADFNVSDKSTIQSNARKRSVDQKPSHRKEKRKKSDSLTLESNKQILNKNIIINVNDCVGSNTENCDSGKSVFNLFFTKADTSAKPNEKKVRTEKEYSEKYVKRKETTRKISQKANELNKQSISNPSIMLSPLNTNCESNTTTSPTVNKSETKAKLQTIDMFLEQPKKKCNNRNKVAIEPVPPIQPANTTNEKPFVTKPKTVKQRSVSTQAHNKCLNKFSQTAIKKQHKGIQTDVVTSDKVKFSSKDPFERMKEIDLEIQTLLQEKFKLYNSMESINVKPNELPPLGVTVLRPAEKNTAEMEEDTSAVDSIVEEFNNIPVEELENIALETFDAPEKSVPKLKINLKSQQILDEDQTNIGLESLSAPSKKKPSKKKRSTPNISLLEQIISDERPLEDIISLEDLEIPPVKTKQRKKPLPPPKKKVATTQKAVVTSKTKPLKVFDSSKYKLKNLSVVIEKIDISSYLNPKIKKDINSQEEISPAVRQSKTTVDNAGNIIAVSENTVLTESVTEEEIHKDADENQDLLEFIGSDLEETVIEETISEMHFDMLDVSEDIVIADNVELKSHYDKDSSDDKIVLENEEIILNNNEVSADEGVLIEASHSQYECKTYDYSTNENLKRDTITVSGNGDSVLAIECIENNFLAACLDGNVYYFSSDGQLLATLRGSNLAVTCLTIVKEKYGTTVYTGSLDSRIRYYDLETSLEKGPECNVLSPIQTMDRAWDTVFVGTRTGFVLQFECKNNMLIPVSTVKFSEQSILALRAMKEGPRKVLLVAARSENITVKDAMTGLLLRTLEGPKMTVYTLLYEDGKVYCGTSSHQIHVFDYCSGSHVGSHTGGKGAVCLRAAGGLVFAGCYDGCVYVYREGETRAQAQLRGPGHMLLSLALLGNKIIAGYNDRSLYIWKIPVGILEEMIL